MQVDWSSFNPVPPKTNTFVKDFPSLTLRAIGRTVLISFACVQLCPWKPGRDSYRA